MKRAILATVILLFLFSFLESSGQIVINEFVPANISGLTNGSGNYDDWIELYNAGTNTRNLQGYGLSDDITKPYKFRFPSYSFDDGHYLIVFANDVNNTSPVNHWETAVKASTSWKYFAGTSQPDTNWRNISFNDGSWSSGTGGIGFGDGDDQTSIATASKSVMMRKSFTITDTSIILKAIFNIDYDDGFVAYLNGSEIARANIGIEGDRPKYNDLAILSHEAVMYQGLDPDSFFIDPTYLKSILIEGVNVLAVEVHNQLSNSNDLSAAPFLTFGIKNSGMTFSNPPSWFNRTTNEAFSAKFKLKRNGGTIFLTDPSGNTVDQQDYLFMQPDNSMGRKPDGNSDWCLIKTPTPGASNDGATCYEGYSLQPIFSIDAGFYSSAKDLTLTNSTPGGVIRYTTDGSTPTTSSTQYTSKIHLTAPKTIRARVFATGYLPSPIITNTYVINDVIKMPVFSVTTDPPNLWDENDGIYVLGPNAEANSPYKGANFWQDWKKPATIEYFDKGKSKIFNFDAEIKIYGNYSRSKPQKSLEIMLSDRFGTGELNYTFIPDKPTIDKVDNIVLRNSGTDWNVVHFRDAFMERVMKPTHSGYIATEPAVMYLNGAYWGVFTIHENHDHHWIENNYHFKESEIDYMKEGGSNIEVKNGTDDFFWESFNYATTQNANSQQYYSDMSNYWDLDNYKDYFIAETYYNNGDWIGDWTNNIKLWRPRLGGKLRYLLYDLDFGVAGSGNSSENRLAIAINPAATSNSSKIFKAILGNTQFKQEFINRYADLINTIYKPASMLGIMHQFQDSMSYDMAKHFAKWGSTMSNWQSNINEMKSFINSRPAKARDQIQSQFNLKKQVTLTFNTSPAGSGRIQVSTIIPESLPWSGVYFDGNPVTIVAIPNPGFTFDRWDSNHAINNDHNQTTTYNFANATETITAYFNGSSQPPLLTVTEFNYNSDSVLNSKDWIELHNYGSIALNMSGWKFKDQDDNALFTFPTNTVLEPNSYLVVASDLTAFHASYPSVNNVVGPFEFQLSNGGDQIRIFDSNNLLYLSFYYQDISPWPPLADGFGYTCELSSNTANLNNGSSWYAGCIGGSPGKAHTSGLSTTTHISGNTTFCQGGSTRLSVNYTAGYNYQWQRNLVDIPGATDTIYTTNVGGSYTARVNSQGCSSVSDALNVTIVSAGQAPVVSSGTRCGEGTLILTATATDSIYWFDAPSNGNIVGTGTSFTTPTLNSSTTYYAQSSLSCPSLRVPVLAQIFQIPATPVVSNITRCGPGSVLINAIDTAIVNWFNSSVGGGLIFSGNVFQTGYIPNDTVFYAEAGTVCVSERVKVTVTITSAVPPVVSNASRCGPGSLTFTATAQAPILWFDSIVAGNQVGTGTTFTTPLLSVSKDYYAEANNGCASPRVLVTAEVNVIPAPPIGFDSSVCGGGSVPIYATSNVQVFWYSSPTGGTALGSGSLFETPVIDSDTVFYAESFDICSSTRTPVHARIEPIPSAPVGSDAVICGSGAVLLSAFSPDPVYWFSQPNGSAVLGAGNDYLTPVLNATTVFYAIVISNCPSEPTAVTAFIKPLPSLFLGNDTTIQSGANIILDAGPGFDFYHWSDGESTQAITVNSNGIYSVEISKNGCTNTDEIMINVLLGIQDESTLNGSINLFPNPVKDHLTMQFESRKPIMATLKILDMTGKLLIREQFRLNNGPNTHSLDLSGLAKGIYLVTLESTDFTKTMSITVQ